MQAEGLGLPPVTLSSPSGIPNGGTPRKPPGRERGWQPWCLHPEAEARRQQLGPMPRTHAPTHARTHAPTHPPTGSFSFVNMEPAFLCLILQVLLLICRILRDCEEPV